MVAPLRPAAGGVGRGASSRPALRVTDVFRRHGAAFDATNVLTPEQGRVLRALMVCRTAALGGHLEICDSCGFERPAYNSCRDRHCPGCQALAQHRWVEQRLGRVLPTHHFHVVFTLPEELRALAYRNRATVYALMMRAAADVLSTLGEQRLGATLGITEVLHTWTREMLLHPHVHCVVTGGGLSLDDTRWVPTSKRYLFPVAVLRKMFQRAVRNGLLRAASRGELAFGGACSHLEEPNALRRLLRSVGRKKWVVYCKPPFAGAEHVFSYLGRYTHRVAISDHRLVLHTDDDVVFRTRGTASVAVTPIEFMRRFLLHVLPIGFHKIRHFGLYAGALHDRLALAAAHLGQPRLPEPPDEQVAEAEPYEDLVLTLNDVDVRRCPACRTTVLRCAPLPSQVSTPAPMPVDTS